MSQAQTKTPTLVLAPAGRPDTAPRRQDAYPEDWVALARSLAEEFKTTVVARDRGNLPPIAELRRLRESGIVNLLYPTALGGGGGTVRDAAYSVFEIARADGSMAALLSFHFYNSLIPLLVDYTGANDDVVRRSVARRLYWGNVTQYVNKGFVAERHDDGGYVVSGTKTWNTGAPLAEITTVLAVHPDRIGYVYSVIPTDRAGLRFHDDWDQLGLRGADSSAITFDNVRIYPDEVLHWSHGAVQTGPVPFWTSFGAVFYAAVFLGAAQGALDTARAYATGEKRQSTLPGATVTADDILVQVQFGELWLSLQAALAFFDQIVGKLEAGWADRRVLSEADRGRIAVETLALRSHSSKVALEITPRIFEFGGGRATNADKDFDRYWRDVRTLSSHDPAVLAMKTIGNYGLTGKPLIFPSHFPAAKA